MHRAVGIAEQEGNSDKIKNDDNISITVKFSDGSVGNLVYTANGDKGLPKERFEIYGGESVFLIDDFNSGASYRDSREKKIKTAGKGHKQEVEEFIGALEKGHPLPISFRSICLTTLTTFKIQESLATGLPQSIDL